ncbi:MAG: dTDP-glucose 4,6-dehydratase [Thermoflexales bacterium]|nr:dTDP-glucose 4,6-dehydratase [Thermoflexales bacterium]MDW8351175.1 dTDP-glucose 4,6-dehydratase [Anaerolineae bacterium]
MKNVMITGGAGFIGSNYVRYALEAHPDWHILVLDKLTYAGNLDNLQDVAEKFRGRYSFVQADIADREAVFDAIRRHQIDTIVNFAAESHVDRSILDPDAFVMTDVFGTYVLLEATREFGLERFHQVSTDEVYGDVPQGHSQETDPLAPNSPYAASKASADLLIRSYRMTYNAPVTITRGSNTFGPYQYPEKLLPLFITNAIDDLPLPLYGDGMQVRDWLYVMDHVRGIDIVLTRGQLGEAYNVGGENERHNIDVVRMMLRLLGKPESLIKHVADRPGHDRRYALDTRKLRALGWAPRTDFEAALRETVDWYVNNAWWWRKIKSGEFKEFYRRQYEARLAQAV